jgi:hypothetical protein
MPPERNGNILRDYFGTLCSQIRIWFAFVPVCHSPQPMLHWTALPALPALLALLALHIHQPSELEHSRNMPSDCPQHPLFESRQNADLGGAMYSRRSNLEVLINCAGCCAAVAEMCRFLLVSRSRFDLFVRFVHIEKVNVHQHLPDRWGIVQR